MSTAIRRYPEHLQKMVIERRIKGETKGLGYWAAIDAHKHQAKKTNKAVENEKETDN